MLQWMLMAFYNCTSRPWFDLSRYLRSCSCHLWNQSLWTLAKLLISKSRYQRPKHCVSCSWYLCNLSDYLILDLVLCIDHVNKYITYNSYTQAPHLNFHWPAAWHLTCSTNMFHKTDTAQDDLSLKTRQSGTCKRWAITLPCVRHLRRCSSPKQFFDI